MLLKNASVDMFLVSIKYNVEAQFNWNIKGSGSNVATQLDEFLPQPEFK